jgi:hypothetical protein
MKGKSGRTEPASPEGDRERTLTIDVGEGEGNEK